MKNGASDEEIAAAFSECEDFDEEKSKQYIQQIRDFWNMK
jgi:hypothetical protein